GGEKHQRDGSKAAEHPPAAPAHLVCGALTRRLVRGMVLGEHGVYMDASRLPRTILGVLEQIGCSFISGLLCRQMPAGPDGIR
ncbi:MAG: hypothetical protein KDJ47_06605, partial [Hyphomicrobiaceae bacterium]|nr:hypothetical protein [Hyphomicrobiaceae bacterium]